MGFTLRSPLSKVGATPCTLGVPSLKWGDWLPLKCCHPFLQNTRQFFKLGSQFLAGRCLQLYILSFALITSQSLDVFKFGQILLCSHHCSIQHEQASPLHIRGSTGGQVGILIVRRGAVLQVNLTPPAHREHGKWWGGRGDIVSHVQFDLLLYAKTQCPQRTWHT